MSIRDKRDILSNLEKHKPLVLELGCGERKQFPDSIGLDALDYECVDIVGDVYEVLSKMPDRSVRAIYSRHFMEHVNHFEQLLIELSRILIIGGRLEIVVPHFSNPYFYSDHTHKTQFGLYTMSYFARDNILKRKVPQYKREISLELTNVELIFKSAPPFYIRHGIKKTFGFLFNINFTTREFYEENICYLFPCYEIRYELHRQ